VGVDLSAANRRRSHRPHGDLGPARRSSPACDRMAERAAKTVTTRSGCEGRSHLAPPRCRTRQEGTARAPVPRRSGGTMPDQAGDARRAAILTQARDEGSVSVAELSAMLDVATETVRRDLRALVDAGLLRRTHGGAKPVEGAGFETALAHRATSMLPEKQRITEAVLDELGNAEAVYLDEGFTPELIARALGRISRPLA